MTIEQFNNTGFTGGMIALYKNGEYVVAKVDFEEKLFGLHLEIDGGDPEEVSWVRCENVELITSNQPSTCDLHFPVHPLTCDRSAADCEVKIEPRDFTKDGILIDTPEGLVCPCGKYKQPKA